MERALRGLPLEELARLSTSDELLREALRRVIAAPSSAPSDLAEPSRQESLDALHQELASGSPSVGIVATLLVRISSDDSTASSRLSRSGVGAASTPASATAPAAPFKFSAVPAPALGVAPASAPGPFTFSAVPTPDLGAVPTPADNGDGSSEGRSDVPLGALSCITRTVAPLLVDSLERSRGAFKNSVTGVSGADAAMVLDHIRSLLQESDIDSPLLRLATAERQLLQQLAIDRFEELGLPDASFLEFCASNAAQLERLLPITSTGITGLRSASLRLATAVLPSLDAESGHALWRVCQQHFRVGKVEELGWSSIEELRLCASAGSEENGPRMLTASELALDVAASNGAAGCGVLGPMTAEDATVSAHRMA